jgi:hypothetical protein
VLVKLRTQLSSGSGARVAVELHQAGITPREILARLKHLDIDTYVTEQGDLAVKVWEVAIHSFVLPAEAQTIRVDQVEPTGQDALDWVAAHYNELRQHYPQMWIAVLEQQVVASSEALPSLLEELQQRGIESAFVTRIPSGGIPEFYAFHA